MEPIKSNLEPIDEKDMDLEGKMRGGMESKKEAQPFAIETEKPQERVGAEDDASYQDMLAKIQTSASDANSEIVVSDAEKVKALDSESHVQQLVNIALTKGVVHAVKVAKHMDDNYALDQFHDRLLSEQLHQVLSEKGLIEEL